MKKLLMLMALLAVIAVPVMCFAHVEGEIPGPTVLKSDNIPDEGAGEEVTVRIRVTADVYPYLKVRISEQHIHWEITSPGIYTEEGPYIWVDSNCPYAVELGWTDLEGPGPEPIALLTSYELVPAGMYDEWILMCKVNANGNPPATANSEDYCLWPDVPVEQQADGWYEGEVRIVFHGHI
ncbi:MAG: hypothetical protein AB1422_14945 [bacterium]